MNGQEWREKLAPGQYNVKIIGDDYLDLTFYDLTEEEARKICAAAKTIKEATA